ncbi:dihydroorotase [Gracilibacillus halophilus YIM-C55.5]|uniref:Dihydroorotase n=1 Tax=Gracilibacillus halophilus YIM-C55.5 TaxID=1308866 RepID=N4WGA9_9BACI|nr:dihydroorotase [Gracilibacillus halophilus]ENH98304.1 dihydroorotase [Gracilibacillus halophilus YIM-C55.5]
MAKLLTNVKQLSDNGSLTTVEILMEDGLIQAMGLSLPREGVEVIDGKGYFVSPGFVDVHVHLREPGGEAKETIATGTKAAARGGYTTVCAMPNTTPTPDSVDVLEDIQKRIQHTAHIRVLPYASITERLAGEHLTEMNALKQAGAFAFSDDGVGVQSADQMFQAMKEAAAIDMPIVAHCEENSLVYHGVMHEGYVNKTLNLPGIPSVSESVQIARDVLLAEAAGCHYHVCHVSTKESVRVIRDAKRAGIRVTAEVTPHHLLTNETSVTEDHGNFKMNPPLRASEDQQALIEGLKDGTIDFIATDHAPHTEEEKARSMKEAPFGIVGFETAFALLYTHFVQTGTFSLKQLVDWLTVKPAQSFNLPYGQVEVGKSADVTLIDLEKRHTIQKNEFVSKGKNTPFHGWEVTSKPIMTMVSGHIVYEEETR